MIVVIPVQGVAPAGAPFMATQGFGYAATLAVDDDIAVGGTQPGPQQGEDTAYTELRYSELALDPATGDLAFPVVIIRGAPAVVQRIRVRFKFFLGEWFLDRRLGVPYYRDIFVKNPVLPVINSIFRQVLMTTPGVKEVVTMNMRVENSTRTAFADFEARLEDGSIVRAIDEPFIVGN